MSAKRAAFLLVYQKSAKTASTSHLKLPLHKYSRPLSNQRSSSLHPPSACPLVLQQEAPTPAPARDLLHENHTLNN